MNSQKIYSDAIGRKVNPAYESTLLNPDGTVPDEVKEVSEDAARRQARRQWAESSLTQEFLQQLNDEYNSYIDQAISLAKGYHQHQNHIQIIHALIRANELHRIIQEQNNNKPA